MLLLVKNIYRYVQPCSSSTTEVRKGQVNFRAEDAAVESKWGGSKAVGEGMGEWKWERKECGVEKRHAKHGEKSGRGHFINVSQSGRRGAAGRAAGRAAGWRN